MLIPRWNSECQSWCWWGLSLTPRWPKSEPRRSITFFKNCTKPQTVRFFKKIKNNTTTRTRRMNMDSGFNLSYHKKGEEYECLLHSSFFFRHGPDDAFFSKKKDDSRAPIFRRFWNLCPTRPWRTRWCLFLYLTHSRLLPSALFFLRVSRCVCPTTKIEAVANPWRVWVLFKISALPLGRQWKAKKKQVRCNFFTFLISVLNKCLYE